MEISFLGLLMDRILNWSQWYLEGIWKKKWKVLGRYRKKSRLVLTARSLQIALERWDIYLEGTEYDWREGLEKKVKKGSKSSGLAYSRIPVKQLCVLSMLLEGGQMPYLRLISFYNQEFLDPNPG